MLNTGQDFTASSGRSIQGPNSSYCSRKFYSLLFVNVKLFTKFHRFPVMHTAVKGKQATIGSTPCGENTSKSSLATSQTNLHSHNSFIVPFLTDWHLCYFRFTNQGGNFVQLLKHQICLSTKQPRLMKSSNPPNPQCNSFCSENIS